MDYPWITRVFSIAGIFLTGVFTILGIAIGSFFTWWINYSKEKRDRKDRYFFALLEQRFKINQEAYAQAVKLKNVIFEENDLKDKTANGVQDWFNHNCLYLEPELREKFQSFIKKVCFHENLIDHWRSIGQTDGWDSPQTKKIENEIENSFKDIMQGIQQAIKVETDLYYKYLKCTVMVFT